MKIEINQSSESSSAVVNEIGKRKRTFPKICDSVVSVSIFMIFFGLPLFFTNVTLQGLFFEKQIYFYFWALIALIAWTIKGVMSEEMSIRRTPLDIPLLGFLLIYILTTVLSRDHWHSFIGAFGDPSRGLANMIVLWISYYVIFSNFDIKKARLVMIALAAGNFIISIWTILAMLDIQFLSGGLAAPLSLIGSLNSLFIYLSMMIPLLIAGVLKISQTDIKKIIKLPSIVILTISIALNLFLIFSLLNAADGWISLLVLLFGMVFFLVFILSKIVSLKNFSWSWFPMGVFVAVMIIVMSGQFIDVAKIRLPVEVGQTPTASWIIAQESIKNSFFVGSGPATYGMDYVAYKPQDFNLGIAYNLRFNQAAGLISEFAATTGALGIFFLTIVVLSYIGVEVYMLSRHKASDKLYSLGFFTASAIFLVNAIFVRIEGTILILGALISIISMASLMKENDSSEDYINFSLKASPKFALALAFVFMVVASGVIFLFIFLGKIFAADIYMRSAVTATEYNDNTALKINRALILYNKEAQYYVQAAQAQLVLANQEAVKKDPDKGVVEGYLNGAISTGNLASSIAPNDVTILEGLAHTYENSSLYIQGSLESAKASYEKALQLDPHNPDYYLRMAQIEFTLAKSAAKADQPQMYDEVNDMIVKSIQEKSDFAAGYYNLASLQEVRGDMNGAIYNMKNAFSYDHTNQDYLVSIGRLYQERWDNGDSDLAEAVYKEVLKYNNKNINAHLMLATLYEKEKKSADAISEYQNVSNLIPSDQNDLKDKISKMIDNVRNGVSNLQSDSQPDANTNNNNQSQSPITNINPN